MKYAVLLSLTLVLSSCSLFTPQHFETRDLTFQNQGYTFTGTLYTPETSPPYPLIVLAHGAGDSKRSFSVYTFYAKYFSERGIAVFVFDKRGVGDSEGTYTEGEIHFDSLADDLAAAFKFASHLPVVSKKRSGILGISQAGWVIPLAMQKIDTLAFVVNISGPSVPPYYSDEFYDGNELRDDGFTEEEIRDIAEYKRTIARYVGTFDNRGAALAAKERYKERPWFNKLGFTPTLAPEETLRLPRYNHYRREAFDPAPYWNKPSVPVLCLFGDKDSHIPVDTIARRFEALFREKKFTDYTVQRYPDAGHIIQLVEGEREPNGHNLLMLIKGFPEPTEESMEFLERWVKVRVR